jgi:hypothetical protein
LQSELFNDNLTVLLHITQRTFFVMMIKNKMRAIATVAAIVLTVATSCTKEPGVGGTAQVVGRVRTILYDTDLDSIATYYPTEQRVYIVYGNDTIYNNDTRTDLNGYYRFKYLNVGKYTLYTYSECASCPAKQVPVKTTITIAQPKQAVQVKEIVVKNY